MQSNSSLRINVSANFLGNLWCSLMSFVFVPYYIYYMGMEAFGIVGFFTILQAALALIDSGISPTLNREIAFSYAKEIKNQSIHDLLRTLEIICLVIATSYSILIWSASEWLSSNWLNLQVLSVGLVAEVIVLMGIICALRLLEGLYRGAILGMQKHLFLNLANSSLATLRAGGAVFILAYVSPSLKAFFYWQLALSLLTVAVFQIFVYQNLPEKDSTACFSIKELKKIWLFFSRVFAASILALFLTQFDKIILSRMLTLEQFGFYSFAWTVANLLINSISPVVQAFFPKLSNLLSMKKIPELKSTFHVGAQFTTTISASIALTIFFFGERIILIWTGNPELASGVYPVLQLLTLGTFFNCLMQMPYCLLLSHGEAAIAFRINLISLVFFLPAIIASVKFYGGPGAAFVWLILNLFYITLAANLILGKLIQEEKWKWYWQDVIKPSFPVFLVSILFFLAKPAAMGKATEVLFIFFAMLFSLVFALLNSSSLSKAINYRLFTLEKNENMIDPDS
ncbi:MAG: oligosaccharide flippase family protein [Candidatus Riflebacteria bacterium]